MKIRYYGHFDGRSGYSRAAIDNCRALIRVGHQLEVRPLMKAGEVGIQIAGLAPEVAAALRTDAELTTPDAIIVHELPYDAIQVGEVVAHRDPSVHGIVPLICYTTWEAITAPGELTEKLAATFDEVWVPSRANQKAFGATLPAGLEGQSLVRVRVLPHAFDAETLDTRRGVIPPSSDRFRFYYVGAWNGRKNPMGLIRAWAHAFTKDDPVELWIHSPGLDLKAFAGAVAVTGLTPTDLAPIKPVQRFVSEDALMAVHAGMDCFVTASRGEAWNLGAFDAMLAKRHIIATAGLGSDDFLADTSSSLVRSEPAPAAVDARLLEQQVDGAFSFQRVGAQGLTSRDTWREPNYCDLARELRTAAGNGARDLRLGYDPVQLYGLEAVGSRATSYLENLSRWRT